MAKSRSEVKRLAATKRLEPSRCPECKVRYAGIKEPTNDCVRCRYKWDQIQAAWAWWEKEGRQDSAKKIA